MCAKKVEAIGVCLAEFRSELVKDGKLLPPKEEVWKSVAGAIKGYPMSAKAIWQYCYKDAYSSHEILGLSCEAAPASSDAEVESDSSGDDRDQTEVDDDHVIEKSVVISANEWAKCAPVNVQYSRRRNDSSSGTRSYVVLQQQCWTSIVAARVYNAFKADCCFVFKVAKITPSGTAFLSITASCKECNSRLQLRLMDAPQEGEDVTLEGFLRGYDPSVQHGNKRRMSSDQKNEMVERLVSKGDSAARVRATLANEAMEVGEREPAHLPSANALRIAKCRELKKQYLHDDAVVATQKLKELSPAYGTAIRDIGYNPVFVHYVTNSQVSIRSRP
jgi:hypothetical protein